jgi:hypothetical protein
LNNVVANGGNTPYPYIPGSGYLGTGLGTTSNGYPLNTPAGYTVSTSGFSTGTYPGQISGNNQGGFPGSGSQGSFSSQTTTTTTSYNSNSGISGTSASGTGANLVGSGNQGLIAGSGNTANLGAPQNLVVINGVAGSAGSSGSSIRGGSTGLGNLGGIGFGGLGNLGLGYGLTSISTGSGSGCG